MDFPRIDSAIVDCKAHLSATNALGTPIESYLVGHLLVLAASEFERVTEAIVIARALRTGDGHLISFVRVASDRLIRSIKIDQMTGVLGHFDSTCKDSFVGSAIKCAAAIHYDNILSNRHAIAHMAGHAMTLADFETAFVGCKGLFDEFANCLGLTPAEISGLVW